MIYESELRQDLVSGDWIVIAPKRGQYSSHFFRKDKREKASKKDCQFEDPRKAGNKDPMLVIRNNGDELLGEEAAHFSGKDWEIQVMPNKFSVMVHKKNPVEQTVVGPYRVVESAGHHELMITRDHDKNFPKLSADEAYRVFRAFQTRYKKLASEKCSAYVAMFHNWGPKAGASVYHPHYQIIGIPVTPPDVEHSIFGSKRYFQKNKKCVHCVMLEWEKKENKRILFENEEAIVFTPFVSREPFEIRVFPKKHLPYFEDTDQKTLESMSAALQKGLGMLEKNLKDPDYNFFIHTAPIKHKNQYGHYHWHIEAQPKISISAGFELSTGIEITVVDPDEAAKILKQ